MADERKNGLSEALEQGASTAYMIRSAVKAGKAVSGAAKGAAAGPYGAVAGFLWENRQSVCKILASAIALLMLPVVFIMMLPGVIFGGFADAYSPADPNNPILNSEIALVQTATDISDAISEVLREALLAEIEEIEQEFEDSDADQFEIKNPYETDLAFSANQLVSMYCAAKGNDFSSISIDDMVQVLRDNMDHLYTHDSIEETREATETNPETGDESAAEEKWLVYSITYNGERYFAEHIFQLTDAQKELADEYAYNLNLFLSDGMFQELGDWDGSGIPSLGNVHFTDGITEVVYYNQLDERYADKPYGTDNIGGYGCGPTSMAIVVSSLTDEIVDPIQMAQWSYENGYWCEKSGSYHALIPAAARNWGLPVSGCTAAEPQRILDALAEGKLIVALMRKGHFTSSGHFIVLRGVKDGKIMVADPSSYTRSEQLWDLEIFLDEAGHGAGAGGPFWIIG